MFNLANSLTLGRVLTVPVIVLLMYFPNPFTAFLAAVLFFIASVTDVMDGIVARRQNQVTNLGKFLDPLADKLLIGSVLIMLVELGWVPAWITIIIICRELAVTGLRAIAMEKGLVLAADKFGKMKTVCQSFALGPLLLNYQYFGVDWHRVGTYILYVALFLTVFSGANYMYNLYKIWLSNDQ
jgi:CDP-diacylglycerol--glycerol-3-phosphate 3-phosphatidyltransferase